MDLKKEFVHRNIKQEADSELDGVPEPCPISGTFLQVKFEDTSQDAGDQIESQLEAILNADYPKGASPLRECKIARLDRDADKAGEKQICRLCAQPIRGSEIFLYADNSSLEQKINHVLPISTALGDGLPEYICKNCEINLNIFYDFVCQVVNADKTIRQRLANPPDYKVGDVTNVVIKEIFGADLSELEAEDSKCNQIGEQHCKNSCLPSKDVAEDTNEAAKRIHKPLQDRKGHSIIQLMCLEADCKEVFFSEKLLHQHMKDKHNVPVICYNCGKIFVNQEALQKHKDKMHFDKVCESCGMSFKSVQSFKMHRQLHADVEEHQCVYCYKTFKFRYTLHRHTRQNHSGKFTLLLDTNENDNKIS